MGNLTIHDFRWEGKYVAFTDHAKIECRLFKIDAYEVIEMLRDSFECPEKKKHNKKEKEICSKKNRKIFRIILFEDHCSDVGEDCWCVKHVKPT